MSKDTVNKHLKPYTFQGVELTWEGDNDAVGDCPFCGKRGRFFVSQATGQYSCRVCGTGSKRGGGNAYTFLQELHSASLAQTSRSDYTQLAADRAVRPATLRRWGVVRSAINGEWLIPTYNQEGKLNNLYAWRSTKDKRRLMCCSGMKHQTFGRYNPQAHKLIICEGPWDAMALEDNLTDEELQDVCVLGVPGCNVFRTGWLDMFEGKAVSLIYDNDYPKQRRGQTIPPAGYAGYERACYELADTASSVSILQWGDDGYDADLPDGYDVRDYLNAGGAADDLLARLRPAPSSWATGGEPVNGGPKLQPAECETYDELALQWKKALKWSDNLDVTLSVMLACVASTQQQGDQLWLRVMGPPGSAKSTLCEAVTVSSHIYPISIQTGLHSGYVGQGKESKKDSSIIPQINGKTVVIKDGDTLLNGPNRDQTLAELRDIYDGTSRAVYRNRQTKTYTGLRITFILAGTRSLAKLNRSFLGDRFLDCAIYDAASEGLDGQTEIVRRAAWNQLRQLRSLANGEPESRTEERITRVMQLTGGFVNHLRSIAMDRVNAVRCSEQAVEHCMKLGELVGLMRARQDKDREDEDYETELPTRLAGQFVRLCNFLAVVLDRDRVDGDILRRANKVARDTCRGVSWSVATALYNSTKPMSVRSISAVTGISEPTIRRALQFLKRIDCVRTDASKSRRRLVLARGGLVYRLSSRTRNLCRKVS